MGWDVGSVTTLEWNSMSKSEKPWVGENPNAKAKIKS